MSQCPFDCKFSFQCQIFLETNSKLCASICNHGICNMGCSCYIFSFWLKIQMRSVVTFCGLWEAKLTSGKLCWAASTDQAPLWRNLLSCGGIAASWKGGTIYHSPKWKHSLNTNVFFSLCLIAERKSEKEMSKQRNSGV